MKPWEKDNTTEVFDWIPRICELLKIDLIKKLDIPEPTSSDNYYFIYYKCKSYGWKPKEQGGQSTGCNETECQEVTNIQLQKTYKNIICL